MKRAPGNLNITLVILLLLISATVIFIEIRGTRGGLSGLFSPGETNRIQSPSEEIAGAKSVFIKGELVSSDQPIPYYGHSRGPCLAIRGVDLKYRFFSCEELGKRKTTNRNLLFTSEEGWALNIKIEGIPFNELSEYSPAESESLLYIVSGPGGNRFQFALKSNAKDIPFIITALNGSRLAEKNRYSLLLCVKDQNGIFRLMPVDKIEISRDTGVIKDKSATDSGTISKYHLD